MPRSADAPGRAEGVGKRAGHADRSRGEEPGPTSGRERAAKSGSQQSENAEAIAEDASGAVLGANPFVGLDARQILGATPHWLRSLSGRPATVVRNTAAAALELGRIAIGRSEVAPKKGDRRFADPAWSEHPVFHRGMQSYLLLASTLHKLIDEAELDWKNEQRMHYAVTMLTDALAPTNSVFANPAVMKRAFDTAGISLVRGARNMIGDLRHNGGMPSMVDKRPFQLGRNVAVSPGAVVYRDEVLELIQYRPSTETVYRRPLVMIPPQINKYYIMDLAPGRSFIEFAVGQGIPYFTVSWRNPTAAHREWDLDTYVQACLTAAEVAAEITGSEDCNLFGLCAGGITMALLLGHLGAKRSKLVNAATFAVTIMDTESPSLIGMFASRATLAAAVRRSRSQGYLDGAEMSRVFAWLRPNDLVWNYWVNNYLMGNDPPAFDILFWNSDHTRLPAGLHADFIKLFDGNPLKKPGAISVLGTPVDLKTATMPAYVLAGLTDHIVPWAAAYGAMQLLGGPSQFVLSSSGHIQSLVNPPGNPKASYVVGGPDVEDPQEWLRGATEVKGSWWGHWARWMGERSDERVPAAERLGSEKYAPLEAAPGRYVHDK
ncbi:MAG TPA: alpha/beta fold hydrolase [Methylomirabilota bacterium]|nr:alpha/beta fold hydrolase [Methylomirabilota bacterium]